jgi:uncharacterized alkaline shock family protein YloU
MPTPGVRSAAAQQQRLSQSAQFQSAVVAKIVNIALAAVVGTVNTDMAVRRSLKAAFAHATPQQ